MKSYFYENNSSISFYFLCSIVSAILKFTQTHTYTQTHTHTHKHYIQSLTNKKRLMLVVLVFFNNDHWKYP